MSLSHITISSITPTAASSDWQWTLAHDRPDDLVIWTTRGQGRLVLNGTRRGVGPHNAIYIPAGQLFSLELGRASIGSVITIPVGSGVRLPMHARQLRIRDNAAINDFTGRIDAATREAASDLPLTQDALDGHMALVSVWLRRQIALEEHLPLKTNAAARLTQRFFQQVVRNFRTGMTMADHAAALGVTGTHLARACKAACGHTAADILTQRVLHAARTDLAQTKAPIQDIARHLGFGSAAYFTRFVQTHTGQTPSALRKAAATRSG